MTPLLGYQDYMATGSVDLFRTFEARMYERTQIALVDSTGLVNTSVGRHLYSWDPPASKEMFVNSAHASVSNSFAIRGLEALAEMAAAAGNTANATKYVDIMGVFSNVIFLRFFCNSEQLVSGMLATAVRSSGTIMVRIKTAFTAGSSQHGKALLASKASNCVDAIYCSLPQ